MWTFIGLEFLTLFGSFVILWMIVKGAWLPCLLGWHRSFYEWSMNYNHDIYTNKVKGTFYEKTCQCGKVVSFKPGSRKFNKVFERVEKEWTTDPELIIARAARNLMEGHEIDLVTGEPVARIERRLKIESESWTLHRSQTRKLS
jgi:hypothetical protein